MSLCDILSQASTRCRNSAMVVAGNGERVISRFFYVPYMFNWRGIWLSCWPGQLLYTTKSRLRRSSHMWACIVLLIIFLSKKWQWHGVNNLFNVADTVYFTLQKYQMWPRVVTDGPHTMTPEMRPVCRGWMHSERLRSPSLRRTRVRPSVAYRQNLFSFLKATECHSTLQ